MKLVFSKLRIVKSKQLKEPRTFSHEASSLNRSLNHRSGSVCHFNDRRRVGPINSLILFILIGERCNDAADYTGKKSRRLDDRAQVKGLV